MALTVGTNSYISQADATTYFGDALHAASWTAASSTQKDQALVTAYRMLERQVWQGSKTSPTQTQSWPRSGLSDPYGVAVPSGAVPQFILGAQCELALALLDDSSVQSTSSSGSNIRRLGAGSAQIEYFAPTTGTRFPTIVQELTGFYLDSANSLTELEIGNAGAEIETLDFDLTGGL